MATLNQNPHRIVYLDLNSAIGENDQRVLVANIEAINVQIYNLLSTDIGTVDYEPFLGSGLPSRLFDQNYSVTHVELQQDLHRALSRWLGDRISVNPSDITVKPDYPNRRVKMQMKYFYKRFGLTVKTEMIFNTYSGLSANLATNQE